MNVWKRSTGLGCAIAIAVTILVNLTLTPACLLTFKGFFEVVVLSVITLVSWSKDVYNSDQQTLPSFLTFFAARKEELIRQSCLACKLNLNT